MARYIDRNRFEEMDRSTLPLAQVGKYYFTACRTEGKTPRTLRGYSEKLGRFVRLFDGTVADPDPQGSLMARTGLIRTRLSRLERDARSAGTGVRRIIVMVPRASYLDTGTECHEHDNCRFTAFGPVETHFLATDPPWCKP
jgi:hypothetical protein